MSMKLIGELELSDGVFEGAKYLKIEFDDGRKVAVFTLLNEAKEVVDDTGVDLYQDKGELFTGMDRWAQCCLEKAADIDNLKAELAECRKQLERKQ